MGRMIESFSYSVNDTLIIQKAKKIARNDGTDFAKYVTALIKQDVNRYGAVAGEPVIHSEVSESVRENMHIKPSKLSVKEFSRWNNLIKAPDADIEFLDNTCSGFHDLAEQIKLLSRNAGDRALFKNGYKVKSRH